MNKVFQAVFSSKLYQTSSRKGKIQAAFTNPINSELVKQLGEYIGDEYEFQNTQEENDDFEEKLPNNKHEENVQPNLDDTSPNPDEIKLSEKYSDELNADGASAFDKTQKLQSNETEDDNESADSSSRIKGERITACTKPFSETYVTLSGLAGEIKGTLNVREITQGVIRVGVKNDEMWIYYNDDINLNNVMSPVLELLNAANYYYLVFNRLARTDNAIVFTINDNDMLNTIGTVKNEE